MSLQLLYLARNWREKISLAYKGFSTSKIDSMHLAFMQIITLLIITSEIRVK